MYCNTHALCIHHHHPQTSRNAYNTLLERYGSVGPLAAVAQDPQSKEVFPNARVRAVFIDMFNKTELYNNYQA